MKKAPSRSGESSEGHRLQRPRTLQEHLSDLRGKLWDRAYEELQVEPISSPEFGLPPLPQDIDDLTDKQLMNLFVQLTRWTDFFQAQFAGEDVSERYAEAEVRRLEGLYMAANKPDRVTEAVTWVRAQMESDPEIQRARDSAKIIYARRKLKQMLYESAERDASVVSRELTRRTDAKNPGWARADRGAP
jgi:hypothetical protein